MTWTEWGVVLLLCERAFAIGCGLISGAVAAYRGNCAPPAHKCTHFATTTTGVPPYIEVASDNAVSLDYSSGIKRH